MGYAPELRCSSASHEKNRRFFSHEKNDFYSISGIKSENVMFFSHECDKGCCQIQIKPYIDLKTPRRRGRCLKAGVFIYDPKQKRVLLVQYKGNLWGPPKGSLEIEKNETLIECALREVREETGLVLESKDFCSYIRYNKIFLYYTELESSDVKIQENSEEEANDANGITWIKLECLEQCVRDGHISINEPCKACLKYFLNVTLPENEFILVEPKNNRRRKFM